MQSLSDAGHDRVPVLRAFAIGVLVSIALGAVVWATGVVEEGIYLLVGLAAAVLAGGVSACLQGRYLSLDGAGPLLASRMQGLLAASFGVKLAVLILGVVVLRLAGVKFASTATFCVSFAGAALAFQWITAFVLTRSGSSSRPSGAAEAADDHASNPS